MTSIKIPVHSFVDLITNSSSELFVSATSSTLAAVNKLVDALLIAGGSKFRIADLFDITLEDEEGYEDCQDTYEAECGSRKQHIVIKTKTDSVAATDAAKILSDLTSTFNIQERYNG